VVTVGRQHGRGSGAVLRDAEDARAVVERADEARRGGWVLPVRRGTCGVRRTTAQPRRLAWGKRQAWRALGDGTRRPPGDDRGVTPDWGRRRTGHARLTRQTATPRRRRALVAINPWRRQERHVRHRPDRWQAWRRQLRGPCNDVGVPANRPALDRCARAVPRLVRKGLTRRSPRRRFTGERCWRDAKRPPLPRPGRLVPLIPRR
jgi:hypothetical protein